MKDRTIAVIIPAYNCQDTIENAVESVVRQSRLELIKEIVIVNDGSTDHTTEVIEKLKNLYSDLAIIEVITQRNKGVSAARNRGVDATSADWIAFLDADDEWVQHKLEAQEKVIDSYQPEMVGGNIYDKRQRIGILKSPMLARVKPYEMLIRSFPQTSTVMAKKEVILEFGKFDEKQKYCEDMNLFVKICKKYKYLHMNERLVVFGQGKSQIGSAKGLSANLYMMNEGAKKNLNEFYKQNIINFWQYNGLYMFNYIKYIRRKIIARKVRRTR